MRLVIGACLVALCAGGVRAADTPTLDDAIRNAHDSGKMVSAITPVYSELVKFEFPSGFHGVTQKTNGKFFIFEMVPLQETAAVWTQMVTLTGYQGLTANPNITPQSFATAIGSGFQKSCPETFGFQPLGPIHTDGAQPHDGFAVVASCGSVNPSAGDHSETALIVGIKGTSDYYTIQWAERGPGSPQKIDLKDPKWLAHLTQLKPLVVCPLIPGEKAPYPSCAEQK